MNGNQTEINNIGVEGISAFSKLKIESLQNKSLNHSSIDKLDQDFPIQLENKLAKPKPIFPPMSMMGNSTTNLI